MQLLSERTWRYVRGLAVPVALWALVGAVVARPLWMWLRGEQEYDKAALHEWIEEARVFRDSLPEMVRAYVHELDRVRERNRKLGEPTT